MNFGMKSKTFNILGTPDVFPGQVVGTCLETGARILGIISSVNGAGDVASWSLFASVGGIDTIVASSNITAAAVAASRIWWAGLSGRYDDAEILATGVGANSQEGYWPMTSNDRWVDAISGSTYELKLAIDTTLFGQVIVLYTVDPPNCYGDHA